jgi:hypothetical protein
MSTDHSSGSSQILLTYCSGFCCHQVSEGVGGGVADEAAFVVGDFEDVRGDLGRAVKQPSSHFMPGTRLARGVSMTRWK